MAAHEPTAAEAVAILRGLGREPETPEKALEIVRAEGWTRVAPEILARYWAAEEAEQRRRQEHAERVQRSIERGKAEAAMLRRAIAGLASLAPDPGTELAPGLGGGGRPRGSRLQQAADWALDYWGRHKDRLGKADAARLAARQEQFRDIEPTVTMEAWERIYATMRRR
jgi:hypothetical protein